jgi:hypothetical protein
MDTNRKIAIIVGVLFIIGTVAGILSLVFTSSILNAPDYLMKVSANENKIIIGALFVLVMGFVLAMVPVVMFPILKKHNEVLAIGYVVFRGALETITHITVAISWLLLLPLSQEYVKAVSPDTSYFQTFGTLLQSVAQLPMGVFVFSLGALMIYYLFYQSKLIPRWLSVWGLIGAILYLAVPLIFMFGSKLEILYAPLAVQEMVMAVWLIVKGFNPSAIASASAKQI